MSVGIDGLIRDTASVIRGLTNKGRKLVGATKHSIPVSQYSDYINAIFETGITYHSIMDLFLADPFNLIA